MILPMFSSKFRFLNTIGPSNHKNINLLNAVLNLSIISFLYILIGSHILTKLLHTDGSKMTIQPSYRGLARVCDLKLCK